MWARASTPAGPRRRVRNWAPGHWWARLCGCWPRRYRRGAPGESERGGPREVFNRSVEVLGESRAETPALNEELGELTEPAKRLVATLEMIPLARFVPCSRGWMGQPSKDRLAIASAFVAKAVYGFNTTRRLLDALAGNAQLRRICGWREARQVPHEATFFASLESSRTWNCRSSCTRL